jgi:flagellar basal body-associated protein FliL
MTGTPLLIGQIVTVLLFAAVGLGLVLWLFRADPPARRPTPPGESEARPAPPAEQDGTPR